MSSGALLTLKGVEDLAVKELKRLCKVSSLHTKQSVVLFEVRSFDDLCKVAYTSQIASRVLLLSSLFPLPSSFSPDEFFQGHKGLFANLPSDEVYAVLTLRAGEHSFSSQEVTSALAKELKKRGMKVSFKENTATLLCVIVDDQCYVGLDVGGFDLSKREHRMFTTAFTIKATLAAAMVECADLKDGMVVLDPCCRDGTLMIEAALHVASRSPRFFEKRKVSCEKKCSLDSFDDTQKKSVTLIASDPEFRHLSYAKRNAKIVQVDGVLDFRKSSIDDIDIKYEGGSVDRIITALHPAQIKNEKVLDHFFARAGEILAKKGVMILAAPCKIPTPDNVTVLDTRAVWMGKDEWTVVRLTKKKGKVVS